MARLGAPLALLVAFWAVAVVSWQATGNLFLLFNFTYIGTAVGAGVGLYVLLPRSRKPAGRRFAQLLVGTYMLVFLGLGKSENMQLEGFFFSLLAGLFSGSVVHYLVAKIAGPILFGRGYCGWSCWTAMVLDYLPHNEGGRGRLAATWEWGRHAHFATSLLLVLILWHLVRYEPAPTGRHALAWLVAGNLVYFSSAIALAYALRNNRAFCKYLCPITSILKTTARFSLLKIEGVAAKCVDCGACNRICPMDLSITKYIQEGKRVLSTECVFCLTCTSVCPEGALKSTFWMDVGGREYIQRARDRTA